MNTFKTVPVPLWLLCQVVEMLNRLVLPTGLSEDILIRKKLKDFAYGDNNIADNKITVHGIDEAAKMVRQIAELTAKNSNNWDAFEALAKDVLKQTYEAGISKGQEA